MYKVFINERLIFFTDNQQNDYCKTNCLVLNFFDEKCLSLIWQLIQDSDTVDSIGFVLKEYEDAFKAFQNEFRIITAAGGLVKNNTNEVLSIFRLGKWDLPKGKMEEGESVEVTAIREVEEECNVTELEMVKPLPNTFHIYELNGQRILKITYWFEMRTDYSGDLIPQIEEDIERVQWMTEDEIQNVFMKNTYTSIADLLSISLFA